MSQRRNRFSLRYDKDTGTYHIENPSENPVYNCGKDLWLATEMHRLETIDRTVNEWIDCVDAETIWQNMKRSVDDRSK